jgi:non-ribosomal peptide synthase protein (TIGR01720 family)
VRQEAERADLVLRETGDVSGNAGGAIHLDKGLSASLMGEVHRAFTTEVNDIFLSGLVRSLSDIWGVNEVGILLEGHGREKIHVDIAVDRTVGWFTTVFPVVLAKKDAWGDQIVETKERLRRVPNQGLGFGLLEETPELAVTFNYLGEIVREEEPIPYGTGESIAAENRLPGKLAVNVYQYAGSVHITAIYEKGYIQEEEIGAFLARYQDNLRALTDYCLRQETVVKTPSDFSVSGLTVEELDDIKGLY